MLIWTVRFAILCGGIVLACIGASMLLAAHVLRADVLAYVNVDPVGRDIYIADVRTGFNLLLVSSPSDDYNPAWSPDGAYIAFNSNRMDTYRIYVTELALNPRPPRLISPQNPDSPYDYVSFREPRWTRDGQGVIFSRTAVPGVSIAPRVVYRAYTGRDMQIVDDGEAEAQHYLESISQRPNISPDGERVAYVENTADGWRLFVGDVGAPLSELEPASDHDIIAGVEPAWSPDGRRIAFAATVDDLPQVFVINPANGRTRQVTRNGGANPVWRPSPAG